MGLLVGTRDCLTMGGGAVVIFSRQMWQFWTNAEGCTHWYDPGGRGFTFCGIEVEHGSSGRAVIFCSTCADFGVYYQVQLDMGYTDPFPPYVPVPREAELKPTPADVVPDGRVSACPGSD